MQGLPASETLLQWIQILQEQDPVCTKLAAYCAKGWPEIRKLSKDLQSYGSVAGEMTVQNNILMHGSRLVIPPPLCGEIVEKIHVGHQVIEKCQLRA